MLGKMMYTNTNTLNTMRNKYLILALSNSCKENIDSGDTGSQYLVKLDKKTVLLLVSKSTIKKCN
jgi:hypothetical protein